MTSKVVVWHIYAPMCNSWCCGHVVWIDDARDEFLFRHPEKGESHVDFAKRVVTETFGTEHVADLDWENCFILDYGEICG